MFCKLFAESSTAVTALLLGFNQIFDKYVKSCQTFRHESGLSSDFEQRIILSKPHLKLTYLHHGCLEVVLLNAEIKCKDHSLTFEAFSPLMGMSRNVPTHHTTPRQRRVVQGLFGVES